MKSLFAPVRVFAFIHLHSENIWEFGEEEKGGKKKTLVGAFTKRQVMIDVSLVFVS